jgi:lipopolysaccharide/colanic/teichoic acid biosynthesis glycosyltransferase
MNKKLFDFLLALGGLMLMAPAFALIALWIKTDSAGPILFRQARVGVAGAPFRILKFRTMRQNAEKEGTLTIGDDPRITRAGRFLRKYKLDELPQLLNVIRGEMSLVGPRPEVQEYFELYPEEAQRAMMTLRPGITGLYPAALFDESELLGRSVDPHQTYTNEMILLKSRCVVQYAAERSLVGDIKIILFTLRTLINSSR